MKQHLRLTIVVSILALVLSAWAVQSAKSADDMVGGTDIEGGSTSSSSEASVSDPVVTDPSSLDTSTSSSLSPDELSKMLDSVNLSPQRNVSDVPSVESVPPAPGSDSVPDGSRVPPQPLPSMAGTDQGQTGETTSKFISTSIQSIGEWLLSLLRSLLNS